MIFDIEYRPSVLKSLKHFPKQDLVQIKKKIEKFRRNLPAPALTKMKGSNPFHKIRYGKYRIIYEIYNDKLVILIVKIGHRKDVYKHLI